MPRIPGKGETVKLQCDVCLKLFEFTGDGMGWIPTTCPTCKAKMAEELDREKRQYLIWAAGFTAKLHREPNQTMVHRYIPEFIATIQPNPEGPGWRVTRWRPTGPSGHDVFTDDQLCLEIYASWKTDPEAGRILDAWADTPVWRRGLLQLDFMALWNDLSAAGDYDACHAMDEAAAGDGGIEAGIRLGRELRSLHVSPARSS